MKRILKIVKRVVLWSITIVALLIGIAITLAYIYEDKVKKAIIEEINKNLLTEITVERIDLSLLSRFPYASLNFKNISANEISHSNTKKQLIKADNIYLQFNIWDLLSKKYRIRRIELRNAHVNLHVFKDYTRNFDIWNKKEKDKSSAITFEIQKLIFNSVSVHYQNDYFNQTAKFSTRKAYIKGDFQELTYKLSVFGRFYVELLQINRTDYLNNDNVFLDLIMEADDERMIYIVKSGETQINNLNFVFGGKFYKHDGKQGIDLSIDGANLAMKSFIHELPQRYKSKLTDYDFEGNVSFKTTIKGTLDRGENPRIIISFGINSGYFKPKSNDIAIENLTLKGKFTNGDKQNLETSVLEFNDISASLNMGQIKGDICYKNFKNPQLDLQLDADFDLKNLIAFFKIDTIENIEGRLHLITKFSGKIQDIGHITKKELIASTNTGSMDIQNFSIKIKNNPLQISKVNSNISFENNNVSISNLTAIINQNEFLINGNARNFLPFILMKDENLMVTAEVYSKELNLNSLLSEDGEKDEIKMGIPLPKNWEANISMKFDTFKFQKFYAEKVTGTVQLGKNIISSDFIKMNAFGGVVSISGYIKDYAESTNKTEFNALLEDVNIRSAFEQLNNFGQDKIVSDNLNGTVNANIKMSALMNSELQIMTENLYVLADLIIENGQLIDYEPVKKLLRHVKIDDVNDIKFQTLSNTIKIENNVILIPAMEIKSNALDLGISGTHSFDNEINYRIRLALSDLLWNKAKRKKENEEFGIIEDDGIKTSLYFNVTGTIDNPQFTYDRQSVTHKIKENIKKEKEVIKQVLKQEFHWFVKDSLKKKEIEKEKSILDKQEEGEFIIEWENQ